MMKVKKWMKSPWAVSIVTALFSFSLTVIYDKFENLPLLSTITWIFSRLLQIVISILTFELKLWWLLVGIIVVVSIIYFIDKFKGEGFSQPDFISYREDVFKNWKWTWSWRWNSNKNAWTINDLKAYCPECNTPLIQHQDILNGLSFDCPRCDFLKRGSDVERPYKIESLILDNIDRSKRNGEL